MVTSLRMDNSEVIEKFERDLWMLIFKAHKEGIDFSNLHFILEETTESLEIKGYSEKFLEEYAPEPSKNKA